MDDYQNPVLYRLKWLYLLLVVVTLMSPVFYVMYISFNENGFGAAEYVFTLDWYMVIFSRSMMLSKPSPSFTGYCISTAGEPNRCLIESTVASKFDFG